MKKLFLAFLLVSQVSFAVTANKVWRIPSGGTLPAWGPVNLADNTNAVTGILPLANLPFGTLATGTSLSSGIAGNFSTSFVNVTNLSVTITTNGTSPIYFELLNADTTNASYIGCDSSDQQAQCQFQFLADGTGLGLIIITNNVFNAAAPGADINAYTPIQTIKQRIEPLAAGSHTFTMQARGVIGAGSGNSWNVVRAKLHVYEGFF